MSTREENLDIYTKVSKKLEADGFIPIYKNWENTEFHFIKQGVRICLDIEKHKTYVYKDILKEPILYGLKSCRYKWDDWEMIMKTYNFFLDK